MLLPPARARFLLSRYVIGSSIALAIAILDVLVIPSIITQSDWRRADGGSIIALALLIGFIILLPLSLFSSLRRQQHTVDLAGKICDHDVADAPLSALQIDTEGALEAGETFEIARYLKIKYFHFLGSFIVVAIIFGWFIDANLIKIHAIHLPPASVFDIVTLALPFVLVALLVLPVTLTGAWQHHFALQADEEWLTVQQSFQRDIRLRWDEVEYILYIPAQKIWPYPQMPFDGYYVIGNAQQFVTFYTWLGAALTMQSNRSVRYHFAPSMDEFQYDMMRVLSTLRAKQGIELRVPARFLARTQELANVWERRDEDEDEEDNAKPVPALIQPRADLVVEMEHSQEKIILRPRLKATEVRRNIRRYCILFVLVLTPYWLWWGAEAIANGIYHVHDQAYVLFQSATEGLLIFCGCSGILLLSGVWTGWNDARKQRLTVMADEQGLHVQRGRRTSTVAWANIRVWVTEPLSEDGSLGVRYFIFGKPSLLWDELPTDTLATRTKGMNETFQQRAEKLHAMIAAKTKLPLLQAPYEPPQKQKWWQRLLG